MKSTRNKKHQEKKNEKLTCWRVFQCEQTSCPAYRSRNDKCWLFSGTYCHQEIQKNFINKIEICVDCTVFKKNIDGRNIKETCTLFNTQLKEYKEIVEERDKQLEKLSMELALGLSEVFEALKKISAGDPSIRLRETSKIQLIKKLKSMVNRTARDIGEFVDQAHTLAIDMAEHFDVLHKVSQGDLRARVKGSSNIELLESLKQVTNEMIEGISREINERKQAEHALEESEKKYFDLYQNAPDGYHSLGPNGKILEVNNTWLNMLGYKRSEVMGKMNIKALLTEEGIKIFKTTFRILKKKGSIENIEYDMRCKDGTLLPVLINATAVYDKKGRFLKSRAIIRNNIEKKAYSKKLEYAAEEWRVTFDSMPYGVLMLDLSFHIIRANKHFCMLYDIPVGKIRGKSISEIIDSQQLHENIQSFGLGRPLNLETSEYFDPALNKHFMQHMTIIPDQHGLTKAFVLALVDISEMKDKEKRLADSRDAFLNMLKEIDFSYKELQSLFNSLIRSFVNAIDAKSPWTKGHSERVTNYATAIAKEMGMENHEIDTLRIASLLHDIGKIGTYDILLDKPGRLTAEEFKIVMMHPVKGEEILRPIGQFQNLLPIIRHHHERIDGKGYPDGIRNGQIPMLSKIITIADSFDSMTSDRPYRPAPNIEYAVSELKRCSGTQFEPQAVQALFRVLKKQKRHKNLSI